MADASLAIVPTRYQASTFPERWQHKIEIVHEGVPEAMLQLPRLQHLTVAKDVVLGPDVPVVTFISRNLEPMRGFPTFMRSLPSLMANNSSVQVVIVGGDEVSYSNAPGDGRSWRDLFLRKLAKKLITNGCICSDECHTTNYQSYIVEAIYTSICLRHLYLAGA